MLLKAENITVYYDKILALENVTVEVGKGEAIAVLGRNGAGKTTLLRAIMGIVKPRWGRVFINGIDVTDQPPWTRARYRVGYVPEGRRLFPYLTVEENLVLGAYIIKNSKKIEERLEYVYNMFPRLRERRRQLAGTLSGGEAQMLAIGRCLMVDPLIALMDEPSLGLAPKIVDEVFATISKLRSEGVAILLVEQNVKKALEVAERVYLLETGRLVYHAHVEEAMKEDKIRQMYLGR
ncbi:MAG: ABC transporter ATP-binding protein [Desulfurococcaceae archaeon]